MEVHEGSLLRRWPGETLSFFLPLWAHCTSPRTAMETFCETMQFHLRHLEDSVYPVMTEEQFAVKLFPMYRYFVTVWLRDNNPEVRLPCSGVGGPHGPWVTAPQPAVLVGLRYRVVQGDGELINGGATWAWSLRRRLDKGPWRCWMRVPFACLPGLSEWFTYGSDFRASSVPWDCFTAEESEA